MKIQTNYIPTDLNKRSSGSPVFTPSSTPAFNSAQFPSFKGLLAEQNFADLIQNDNIRNKDASYIIGGRLFEAVVDATGAGDYKSIQDALDAGNNRIFVRSGTYIIDSVISIDKDNVFIVGENKFNTILIYPDVPTSNYNIFLFGNGTTRRSNLTISNLTLDGNRDNQTTAETGIKLDTVDYFTLSDCIINNFEVIGVDLFEDNKYLKVNDCNFFDNDIDINFADLCFYYTILNNIFDATDSTKSSYCIYNTITSSQAQFGIIKENFIKNKNLGFFLEQGYANVIGNFFDSIQEHGIQYTDGRHNIIANNNFYLIGLKTNDTYSGIIFDDTSIYNTINGNHLTSVTGPNKVKYGIRENHANCDYNIITSNNIHTAITASISTQGANTVSANNI